MEHRAGQPPRVLARWPRGRFSAAVPHLDVLELNKTWYWLGLGELLAISIQRQRQPPRLQRTPLKLAWEWNGWLCFNRDRTGFWAFAEGMPGVVELWPRQAPIQALPVAGGQHLSTRTISRLTDGRLMVGSYAGTFTQAADSPLASLRRWMGTATGPSSHLRIWPADVPEHVWFCSLRLPDARLVLGLENSGIVLLTGQQFQKSNGPGPTPTPQAEPLSACCAAGRGSCGRVGRRGCFSSICQALTDGATAKATPPGRCTAARLKP